MNKIKKVLVVDDSKLARLTLSRLLAQKGIEVLEADSVSEALAILATETVDSIFLDVQMPEQTGFDALHILKNDPKLKAIPCSMYSGDLSVQAQKEAILSGAQAYLFKPANSQSLEHVLTALEENIIADDMVKYATASEDSDASPHKEAKPSPVTKSELAKKHRKAIATLDGRTRHLARIINDKNQEIHQVSDRLSSLDIEVENLKKYSQFIQHEELQQKRSESNIRVQLQETRANLRLATTVAVVATLIAGLAMLLSIIIYFSYLK